MKKVKVAIIDSGIDMKCKRLTNLIASGYKIFWENKITYDSNFNDEMGHGTACASTIYRECKDIELIILKIMNKNGKANILVVEEALRFLLHMDVNIINMSFSIPQMVDSELYSICSKLVADNKILVASFDNRRAESYPCFFDNVIGVQGAKLNSLDEIWFDPDRQVQCIIDNTPVMHLSLKGHYQMRAPNNSLATARFTGVIAKIMSQNGVVGCNYSEIISRIFEYATRNKWNVKEIEGIRITKESGEWFIENNDPILLKVYDILRKEKNIYPCSENICDYELLTSKGCIKFDDVGWLINKLRSQLEFNVDFLNMDRYDLLTLGTLAKFLINSRGGVYEK